MTIDPSFLDELDRFRAALERESTAVHMGDHESPRVGEGLTFSDYRRYAPGDDVRLVDWKVFARTEEYYIKQFEEERSLTVHVLVDASASMDYGESSRHKFEYGAKIGLGFAHLTAAENNDFVVGTLRDRVTRLDTDRSTRGEVLRLVDAFNETTPAGGGDLETALTGYADRVRTRSLVLVISDCLADPDAIGAGVAALTRNDTDVLLVRVLAPEERDPGVAGDALFVDPETEETRRSYFSGSLAQQYRSRLDAHVDAVENKVTQLGEDHVAVDTGADYFTSFADVWLG